MSDLPAPFERDRLLNIGVQRLVNGAGMGRVLEAFAIVFGEVVGDVNGDAEAADSAKGRGDHFLGNADGRTGDVDVFALGDDAHGGEHASAKSRGHQIGGAEGFALAHVVHGGVGLEDCA